MEFCTPAAGLCEQGGNMLLRERIFDQKTVQRSDHAPKQTELSKFPPLLKDIRQDPAGVTGVPFTRTSLDSPPATLDYIGIISTNDFFVQIKGNNNLATKQVFGKLWGYRAKADAATYAALVQSEVLSS